MTNSTFEDVATVTSVADATPRPDRDTFAEIARCWIGGLLASSAWLATAGVSSFWPDIADSTWERTHEFALLLGAVAGTIAVLTLASRWIGPLRRIRRAAPWLTALAALTLVWEIATAKAALLPMPFFPPPKQFSKCWSTTTHA